MRGVAAGASGPAGLWPGSRSLECAGPSSSGPEDWTRLGFGDFLHNQLCMSALNDNNNHIIAASENTSRSATSTLLVLRIELYRGSQNAIFGPKRGLK